MSSSLWDEKKKVPSENESWLLTLKSVRACVCVQISGIDRLETQVRKHYLEGKKRTFIKAATLVEITLNLTCHGCVLGAHAGTSKCWRRDSKRSTESRR